ncbi:uncharacterized protein LOC143225995 isoform X2 [Tachypleus tridentatus]|uniref:uncharacterized protein LOC143225995 isoform X2 n=1 Tax=Tachypleus tridentatus TaxID=6853 RepID=UPI003FD34AF0
MNQALRSGALIVFNGFDHAGKTTQCHKLVEILNEKTGHKEELVKFPDRAEDNALHCTIFIVASSTAPSQKSIVCLSIVNLVPLVQLLVTMVTCAYSAQDDSSSEVF